MQIDLLKQRVLSFLWQMGIAAVLALLAWLVSDEARAIVEANLGTGVVGMLVWQGILAGVLQVRNMIALAKANNDLGAVEKGELNVVIL